MISNVLRDLTFSPNQPLKWADEYLRILKKENKELKMS
jgi:hypothetical protein